MIEYGDSKEFITDTFTGTLATVTPVPTSDEVIAGVDDFDGNGVNDLAVYRPSAGTVEFWLLGGANGTDPQGAAVPLLGAAALPSNWKFTATGDFNRDGWPDLLWRNATTQKLSIWAMSGAQYLGAYAPNPDQAVDANWEVVGALDYNADGNTDLLWYNPNSGKIVLWFMDASVVRITEQFTNPANAGDNNWKVRAMGDYGVGANGLLDTKDIVWRNASSGRFVVWYMDQAGNRTTGVFNSPDSPSDPLAWTIAGPR